MYEDLTDTYPASPKNSQKTHFQKPALGNDVVPALAVDLSSVHGITRRTSQLPRPSIRSPAARFLSDKWFHLRSAVGTPENCRHVAV
ncbi:hypothetical protein THAOC_19214, partial [Thalassiosira oceanica]